MVLSKGEENTPPLPFDLHVTYLLECLPLLSRREQLHGPVAGDLEGASSRRPRAATSV